MGLRDDVAAAIGAVPYPATDEQMADAILPLVIERCAGVAQGLYHPSEEPHHGIACLVAAAIRQLGSE